MRLSFYLFAVSAVAAIGAEPVVDSTVDQSPMVSKSEAKATDIETELLFRLGEPVIVRAEVERSAKSSIRWRVRGDVEYEIFANDTVLVVGWTPGRYEAEFLYIDFDAGDFVEERFIIVMGDLPPPVPVDPVEPITPVEPGKPKTSGTVYVITIRDASRLTADESQALLEITTWADLQADDARHLQFAPDAVNGDGSRNETVKKYYDKIPEGARYPYVFVVQRSTAGESIILREGELQSSRDVISFAEGLIDG